MSFSSGLFINCFEYNMKYSNRQTQTVSVLKLIWWISIVLFWMIATNFLNKTSFLRCLLQLWWFPFMSSYCEDVTQLWRKDKLIMKRLIHVHNDSYNFTVVSSEIHFVKLYYQFIISSPHFSLSRVTSAKFLELELFLKYL